MSDHDPADIEKAILTSDKRFEVYVPKPKARLNLGQPARKKDPDGPFGHPGATLQAADAVFIDAGKEMVLQSKADANFLHTGAVLQLSKDDTRVGAGADMLLTSGQRILLTAGATNDPQTRSDHGTLRMQAYNNLKLHYRVDSLEVGLFEFFHGRRDRPARDVKGLFAKKASKRRRKFDHSDTVNMKELAVDADLEGGYAANALRTLQALYPTEKQAKIFYTKNQFLLPKSRSEAHKKDPLFRKPDAEDPVHLIETLFAHDPAEPGAKKLPATLPFGTDDMAALKHGFSSYFSRFDPYAKYKVSAFRPKQPLVTLLRLKNTLVGMKRMMDCMAYATGIVGSLANTGLEAAKIAPVMRAVTTTLGTIDFVKGRVEAISKPASEAAQKDQNALAELPILEQSMALAEPWEAKAPTRKASIESKDGTFDLSEDGPWQIQIANENGRVVDVTISFGAVPPQPAELSFAVEGLGATDTVALSLEIDGDANTVALNGANGADAAAIAAAIGAVVGNRATVTASDETVTLRSASVGSSARILVIDVEDNDDEDDFVFAKPGLLARGVDDVPPVGDPKKITAAELAARLQGDGIIVSESGKALRISSEKVGAGSRIAVSGNLADALFKAKSDEVQALSKMTGADLTDAWSYGKFVEEWIGYVSGMPGKVQEILQPVVDAAADLQKVLTDAEQVMKDMASMAGGLILPEPPEAIGMFAAGGITLGTHDRLVASGGHGILFVVDGGSGDADKAKQLGYLEKGAKVAAMPGGLAAPTRKKKKLSLGFRVMSDSTVDMQGALAAQLVAMGRGKAKSKLPDGKLVGGLGVARVLGSRAAEIAGYEKVVISARSAGKDGDTDGLTGGRVELAGQTIAIGGVRNEDKDADNAVRGPFDFDARDGAEAHSKSFGIAPVELESIAGLEHLNLTNPNKTPAKKQDFTKLLAPYAWPAQLRKEHAQTQRVHVHSRKEAVIAVGPYLVKVDAKEGVVIGQRKSNEDPSVNELDLDLPMFELRKDGYRMLTPNKDKSAHSGVVVAAGGDTSLIGTDGSGDPGKVFLKEGESVVSAGDKDSITVSKSAGVKVAASKGDVNITGQLKLNGKQIHIG